MKEVEEVAVNPPGRPPRVTLRAFGALRIDAPSPVGARATQKRRLAALAILAAAESGSVTRDGIIALLWPDTDSESARRLLSETIYVVRREFGAEALITAGDSVSLNPNQWDCDLWHFSRALQRGDSAAAANCYAAPFLDAWYVERAPEFERWVSAKRAFLGRQFISACQDAAESLEAHDEWRAAAGFWQRAVDADPLLTSNVGRLALATCTLGDRAGALAIIAAHEQLLREEIGVQTDPTVEELKRAIQRSTARLPLQPTPRSPETAAPRGRARVTHSGGKFYLAGLTLLALVAVAAISRMPSRDPAAPPGSIAILPFEDRTPTRELSHVAAGITDQLVAQLSGVQALRIAASSQLRGLQTSRLPTDSIARLLHVGTLVDGRIQRAGELVHVSVQILDATTGRVLATAELSHPLGELFGLQQIVAERISALLRQRLGRDVFVRSLQDETRSTAARLLAMRAEEYRQDAEAMSTSSVVADVQGAVATLWQVDSLYLAARDNDRSWDGALVGRTRTALSLAALDPSRRDAHIARAVQVIDTLLARHPRHALANALRGRAAWFRVQNAQGGIDHTRLAEAKHFLQLAIAADSAVAEAWATLSFAHWLEGHMAEGQLAAERALATDAYLREGRDVTIQAFYSTYYFGDLEAADRWCNRGRALYPASVGLVQCELTLLRARGKDRAAARRAWEVVAELDAIEPAEKARAIGHDYSPIYRRLAAAAVSARAGDVALARSELQRANAAVRGSVSLEHSAHFDIAHLYLALGDTNRAHKELAEMLRGDSLLKNLLQREPVLSVLTPRQVP